MKKLFFTVCLTAITSALLTGCLLPKTRAMGASVMPSPLQHRANGNDEGRYLSLSGSGFYGHTGSPKDNVKDVNAGGADLNLTYRLGGMLSPLFASASVGAFGGYSGFSCTTSKCTDERPENERYWDWLKTKEGEDSYSFWSLQERIMIGADFNPGPYVIVGFAGGVQLFQDGGDYRKKRRSLDKLDIAEDIDGDFGVGQTYAVWLGSHLGRNGEYGNFVSQLDMYFLGGFDQWTSAIKLTYTHPSGFFAGYQYGSLVSHNFYFGKEFIF